MKGKNVFSKREIELIESLIIKRCNAERTQQIWVFMAVTMGLQT